MDAGVIRASADLSVSERLALIHEAMFDLIVEFSPTHIAIERAFHGKNPASSIKLGEARGVLIAAAGRYGLPVAELLQLKSSELLAVRELPLKITLRLHYSLCWVFLEDYYQSMRRMQLLSH